ncbi:MAG: hypothetical protein JWN67_3528 [Actinomycetia bacterium]|nr:hypothetical protein [Actinomycetes bacterium]
MDRPDRDPEGKLIQVVDVTVRTEAAEHARARALRVRDTDLTAGTDLDGLPASSTGDDPAADLPGPDGLDAVGDQPGVADFLRLGAELRRPPGAVDGRHIAWVRLRVPVVAGEPVRATSRATLPMDVVNLLGVGRLPPGISAINADVSAHVLRPPVGEWVALVGSTRFAHGLGHGVSMATLGDADGVFGVTSTAQVVQALD